MPEELSHKLKGTLILRLLPNGLKHQLNPQLHLIRPPQQRCVPDKQLHLQVLQPVHQHLIPGPLQVVLRQQAHLLIQL